MKHGKLIVISAPSGAGKTTLKDQVLPGFPKMKYSISATTRNPREGEVNGEHYFFKSRSEFEEMIQKEELVEYMEVHGNYYGTPKSFIADTLKSGEDVLLDLDVYGKINFDKAFPDNIGILLKTPSMEVLEKRLRSRATDAEETIQLRLNNARKELEFASEKGKYEYILINDELDRCVKEFDSILKMELEA